MSESRRRPRVFEATDPAVQPTPEAGTKTDRARATPAGSTEGASGTPHDTRHHAEERGATTPGPEPNEATPPAQTRAPVNTASRFSLAGLFFAGLSLLVSLALGLWFTNFISIALARDDWIGWTANALALFLAGVLVIILLREVWGFVRLARLGRLRRDAQKAIATADTSAERRIVRRLKWLMSGRPEYRWALARFREQERHQTRPGELLGLADEVLLGAADAEARRVIYESARRVAVVTAVVPIAFIAVLFVLFENIRLVRRLAGTYGGRPGVIGGLRLLMRVILYIAATGAIALTDDLFGQFLGQDLVRRLSRRLGEGAFNGALTARLGIVAIELCRPCPHIRAKPLRARHVVAELFPEFRAGELMSRAVGRKVRREAVED